MSQAAQPTAEISAALELFSALHELEGRLMRADAESSAVEAVAQVVAAALRATHRPAGDEHRLGAEGEARDAIEAARHRGQVGACTWWAGVEPFALLVPVCAASPPFELLVFRRRSPFSVLEQNAAAVAARLLEAALRQRTLLGELRDSRAQLQQSDRIKSVGQLASGVAHDFNNLLMVISAAAEVMRDTLPSEHPCASQLGLILDTSHRAAELTRRLLAFSRKARPAMKPLDVHEVLGTVRELLAHGIDRRITLQLSPCEGACVVEADATQLGSAILNVCLNARDAMPDGGRLRISTRRVELDAEACASRFQGCEPGVYVCLDIEDTGTGMDQETLARAFEPFFTTKEPGRGTGLGLPVVLATVRDHRGTVVLESEPGGGTNCSILLPLRDGLAELRSSEPASRRMTALRVLLVDDEPRVCLTAAQLMRQLGHNVQALCSGEKALGHLRVHASGYDLLVLDVMMPHPTGLDVYHALALDGIDLPTIFVSGSPDLEPLGGVLQRAGVVFLSKPFRQIDLAEAIARCMEAWQSRATAALRAPLRAG